MNFRLSMLMLLNKHCQLSPLFLISLLPNPDYGSNCKQCLLSYLGSNIFILEKLHGVHQCL